jgi:uncharacterized membrane protein
MLPTWLTRFITALVVLLLLDAVWLTAIAPTSRRVIAAIQGTPLEVRWTPALVVYLLIAAGVTVFATGDTLLETGSRGALLGLVIYGVYDLTNYATLRAYPLTYAASDIAWGTFLCGTTAIVTHWIVKNAF